MIVFGHEHKVELDSIGNVLDSLSIRWERIDGTTAAGIRTHIVSSFNQDHIQGPQVLVLGITASKL